MFSNGMHALIFFFTIRKHPHFHYSSMAMFIRAELNSHFYQSPVQQPFLLESGSIAIFLRVLRYYDDFESGNLNL